MNDFMRLIGVITTTIIMMFVPILTTLSYVYNWDSVPILFLILLCIAEAFSLGIIMWHLSDM